MVEHRVRPRQDSGSTHFQPQSDRSDVTIVPFGDPDLAAVTASDRIDVLRSAMYRGEAVIETLLLGKDVRTDLGWPADGAADQAHYRSCATSGR